MNPAGKFKVNSGLFVAESKINGLGVFASRNFQAGETVLQIDDSRLVNEKNPLRTELGEFEYHCDYLEGGEIVYLRSPERYINSCCDPFVYVKTIGGIRCIVALKPIKTGEEITYDYIIDCHGGTVWQCSCGSRNCRRMIVSSFFELPHEKQIEYLPLLNPWFINEHMEKVEQLRKMSEEF